LSPQNQPAKAGVFSVTALVTGINQAKDMVELEEIYRGDKYLVVT
jgi:hypothetical protein